MWAILTDGKHRDPEDGERDGCPKSGEQIGQLHVEESVSDFESNNGETGEHLDDGEDSDNRQWKSLVEPLFFGRVSLIHSFLFCKNIKLGKEV